MVKALRSIFPAHGRVAPQDILRDAPEPGCLVCRGNTRFAGTKRGVRTGREFLLRRCLGCGFGFVVEPWTDYGHIYDDAYYEGRGSDPSVDYGYEFAQPHQTIRHYEWRGIVKAISHLRPAPAKWLDYGCGNGGLVRYAQANTSYTMLGFDTGAWADKARSTALPIATEETLRHHLGTFDIVTAVEVIEHCVAPLDVLRSLRRLMKPGGLLFLTTGNADKAPRDFSRWYYVSPEIHVSYFTPRALRLALAQAGFATLDRGWLPGWTDVLRFKVLKKLGVRKVNFVEQLLPWPPLARWVERKTGLSAHPLGIAM